MYSISNGPVLAILLTGLVCGNFWTSWTNAIGPMYSQNLN